MASLARLCTGNRWTRRVAPSVRPLTTGSVGGGSHSEVPTRPLTASHAPNKAEWPVNEALFMTPHVAPTVQHLVRPETYTRAVAEFVAQSTDLSSIPPLVTERVKRIILDTLGVSVAGARHPAMVRLVNAMVGERVASSQDVTVWGTKYRCPPDAAAFLNGCAAHVLDFDDTWQPPTHTASPMLPAILALAESIGASGKDVLRAFAIGMEVQGRLLCAAGNANIPTLFHPVGTIGAMGAVAACANLLRLDTAHTQSAMGIVASRCGGLMANVGSTTKCSHAGHSARMGLEAAVLACNGFTGKPDLLDHEEGFAAAYASFGKWDPSILLSCGKPFHLERQDVALKAWPCHLATHWAITSALSLRQEMLLKPVAHHASQIEAIFVQGPHKPYIYRAMPATELDAKFSLQYTTVVALLDGVVNADSFEEPRLSAPDVRGLLGKVRVFQDPHVSANFGKMVITTSVKFKDGTWLQRAATGARGLWNDPQSWQELSQKFVNCVSGSLAPAVAGSLIQDIDQLESVPSVSSILQRLVV